jgi:twitching motility protein PilT
MIVNDENLLPLGILPGCEAQTASAQKPAAEESDFFLSSVAETFDCVDILLAARAEAEEAEAKAKLLPETALPFVKDDKKKKAEPTPPPGANLQRGFQSAGAAADSDSPAPVGAIKNDVRRLSDATGTDSTSVLKGFLKTEATSDPRARYLEAHGLNKPSEADGLLGGIAPPPPAPDLHLHSLAGAHIDDLLRRTVQSGASDLHLTAALPPMVRKDGRLIPLDYDVATERDTQRIVYDILNNEAIEKFERTKELDFSYGVKGVGRFRFNVYRQRGSVGCAMRVIPNVIPTMDQLKLPPVMREMTRKHSGLVLVTGPTGSGKSTTIASMIDVINTDRECHILTIEDPIEYLHMHKKGMVNQRELGTDTDSFNNSLRAALREDPDVILVGEMRDLETISAAITLAETGHLVFATLHTRSAPATIDRIVDVFPAHQQEQIRIQLSTSLEAVVAQQLMPKQGGGRVAAIEIMVATSALRNLIREGKSYQIYSVIETGQQYGMQAMDRVLADLHRSGQVTFEEAATRAIDRENFNRLVKGY